MVEWLVKQKNMSSFRSFKEPGFKGLAQVGSFSFSGLRVKHPKQHQQTKQFQLRATSNSKKPSSFMQQEIMCHFLSSFSAIFVEGKTLRFWRLAPKVLRTLTGTQLRCLAFHEKRRGLSSNLQKHRHQLLPGGGDLATVKDEGQLKFVLLFYFCLFGCLKIYLFTQFLDIIYLLSLLLATECY